MPNGKDGERLLLPAVFHREMLRQGFLNVARDNFGLATRDQALGEPLPDTVFELIATNVQGKEVSFQLLLDGKELGATSVEYAFRHNRSAMASIAESVNTIFAPVYENALETTGYEKKAKSLEQPSQAILREIDQAIASMTVFSQYRAARLCHEEIAVNGKSAQIVSRLARCYANMSQLSTYYLAEMRSVFAARAILYATELHEISPKTGIGYWTQAYVFTIIGLTKDSMWQLERLNDEFPNESSTPDWAEIIHAANQFSYDELKKRINVHPAYNDLAVLLTFRSVEFSGTEALAIETAKEAMQDIPLCLRVLHGLNRLSGVSYRHQTTSISDEVFAHSLVSGLQEIEKDEQLAAAVGEIDDIPDWRARVKLVARLKQTAAEDTREPSIASLGCIVQEIELLHLAQRNEFVRYFLGSDSSEFVLSRRAIYEHHPMAPLFKCFELPYDDRNAMRKQLTSVPNFDLNFVSAYDLIYAHLPGQWQLKDSSVLEFRNSLYVRTPAFEPDYCLKIGLASDDYALQMAKWMSDINPHSALRAATIIRLDWEKEKAKAEKWLRDTKRHPAVIGALAQQFDTVGEFSRAEELWNEYVAVVPEYRAFDNLARLQYQRGDRDAAFATAKAFLQEEDYGLNHARMRNKIAHTLMAEGLHREALPWAQTAAQSYAGFALNTLAHCYEVNGMEDKAELVYRAMDERYRGQRLYYYCVRKGKDLDIGWKYRQKYLLRTLGKGDPLIRTYTGCHHIVNGEPKKAARILAEGIDEKCDVMDFVYLAIAYGESGQKAKLKDIFEELGEREFGKDDPFVPLVDILTAAAKKKVDRSQLESVIEDLNVSNQWDALFVLGFACEVAGDMETAIQYYSELAASPYQLNTVLLSCHRLRSMGADVPNKDYNYKPFAAETPKE